MFEVGKTYKTSGGKEAKILCTDAHGDYPIVGYVIHEHGIEANCWTIDGLLHADNKSFVDLIPEPPKAWIVTEFDDKGEFYRSWIYSTEPSALEEERRLTNIAKRATITEVTLKTPEGV